MTRDVRRIGFQGMPGAFSEDAARRLAPDAEPHGYETFDALVAALDSGAVGLACLPVENAISGSIPRSYDLLSQYERVRVAGELVYEVVQNLIGIPGTPLDAIRDVRSHPVALEQVRTYIDAHPGWTRTVVADTAGAVADVMREGDPRVAAVASALAADRYGAAILAPAIHDDPENFTRFFLLTCAPPTDAQSGTRACVALDIPNARGTLRDALSAFADRGIDLRSLVARPTHAKAFRYRFYVELENAAGDDLADALHAFDGAARILGRY